MKSTQHPLYIAFIWHMHQPYYKDILEGGYLMPWVRLHGIKDYYGMAHLLEEFPDAHVTFSLTPCLLEQIQDYSEMLEQDPFINLTIKPVEGLTTDERVFILKNFFLANWENMVKAYPRYGQLLSKRGYFFSEEELKIKQKYISNQDILDLQIWHNLAWIDTGYQKGDKRISGLIAKNKNFDQADKEALIQVQREILSKIIPLYKRLMEAGQAELINTPYYHPILPLLCNINIAKTSSPDIQIPQAGFLYPADCKAQLDLGIRFHESLFGRRPNGIWPSEGAVSQDLIPFLYAQGIQWLATDEDILSNSLNIHLERDFRGLLTDPAMLYKPYWLQKGEQNVMGVFRDRVLSDLIGFVYQKWEIGRAVDDFVGRLHAIRDKQALQGRPMLVSIIMDGENAWEFYPDNGRAFLRSLYSKISKDPYLKMVTVSEYLSQFPPGQKDRIDTLFPGSWINHNFKVWVGHQEKNTAWEYLASARKKLEGYMRASEQETQKAQLNLAMKALYVAEGSDWFWWYGDDHYTDQADLFDQLYRKHIRDIYQILDLPIPNELYLPILSKQGKSAYEGQPQGLFTPTFDGRITSYFEWLSAVRFKVRQSGGTTHRAESIIKDIFYGFDSSSFYMRIDAHQHIKDLNVNFAMHFLSPKTISVEINRDASTRLYTRKVLEGDGEKGGFHQVGELEKFAVGNILELGISFKQLGAEPNTKIRFVIAVETDENEIERWPIQGYFQITAPHPGYEDMLWQA